MARTKGARYLLAISAPEVSLSEHVPAPVTDQRSCYADQLVGQPRCFNRVRLHDTLIDVAHPGVLLTQMHSAGFCPRDVTRFAQPFNAQIRDNAIALARQHGVEIQGVTRKSFRQEDRIAANPKTRGPMHEVEVVVQAACTVPPAPVTGVDVIRRASRPETAALLEAPDGSQSLPVTEGQPTSSSGLMVYRFELIDPARFLPTNRHAAQAFRQSPSSASGRRDEGGA